MSEITFDVSPAGGGAFVAVWESPRSGRIRVVGGSMEELCENMRKAVSRHFEESEMPTRLRLRFSGDLFAAALQVGPQPDHSRARFGRN